MNAIRLFVLPRERLETDLVVGRMKKPVKSFQEYCATALHRLKLDFNRVGILHSQLFTVRLCILQINQSHLTSVELEYSSRITKLQQFIRVRMCLASRPGKRDRPNN